MEGKTGCCEETVSSLISVIIVDDHPLFREAVRRLLVECREFEIVGEAGDGESAIALAARLHPRIVILDITLPGVNGIDATRQIKDESPETAVVVLSVHDDAEHASAALAAGASAYLTKDVARGEIVQALCEVVHGKVFVCQSALRHLVALTSVNHGASSSIKDHGLTSREMEVVGLLAHGMSNRMIADELKLSTATVKGHISCIYTKLNVSSRTEAVMAALRLGLVDLGDV